MSTNFRFPTPGIRQASVPVSSSQVPESSHRAGTDREPTGNRKFPSWNPSGAEREPSPESWLTPRDRIELFGALGLELYIGEDGELRARGAENVLDAARPALLKHRDQLLRALQTLRRSVP
jgi:hypothetical protein